MEIFGFALMVIAIGVLGWTGADWLLFRPLQSPVTLYPGPNAARVSALTDRLTEYLRIKASRARRSRFLAGCVLFLLAILILLFPSGRGAIGPDTTGHGTTQHTDDSMPPGVAWGSKFITPLMAVSGLALVCGTFMLALGRNKLTRAAGAATILAGFLSHATIIKELKIGEIFKVDTLKLDAEINSRLQSIGNLGPEHIESIGGFVPGKAEVTFAMRQAIDNACSKLREDTKAGKEGLLLIVGSTDRVPLGHSALKQYESNFGLARARAEAVKLSLSLPPEKSADITTTSSAGSTPRCGIPVTKMLALVSGPEHTPELVLPKYDGIQLSTDRSVDLWALWAWHEPPAKHTSVQATIGKSETKKE